MYDKPDRTTLLATARESSIAAVLPHLEGALRQACMMVVNAMAIVLREFERIVPVSTPARFSTTSLFFFGQATVGRCGVDDQERIMALNRRVVTDIRNGLFDGDAAGALESLLALQFRHRLHLADPEFLDDGTFSQPRSE